MNYPVIRPRRLRTDQTMRNLVRETRLSKQALVYPIFVKEGNNIIEEIPSLDGQRRCSPDRLSELLYPVAEAGIGAILLFGLPLKKDEQGSSAWDKNGVVQQAVRIIKRDFPQFKVITDVCLCEYTSHGHCGIVRPGAATVDNDATLELLSRTALSHVAAGADIVAPSDMMDGRVAAIRETLDKNGFTDRAIMAYSVKYASSFYGPFREAAGSAPAFGDRKSYQMDFHNKREALKEARLDEVEGADFLMVKPALSYLDVIAAVRERTELPLAAYSVSGEYAMIRAAAKAGLIDGDAVMCESAVSVFRAGADILITYFAPQLAKQIDSGRIG